MHIPWSELGQVLFVGLLAGAGVVALFAAGVRLLAGPEGGEPRQRAPRAGTSAPVI